MGHCCSSQQQQEVLDTCLYTFFSKFHSFILITNPLNIESAKLARCSGWLARNRETVETTYATGAVC